MGQEMEDNFSNFRKITGQELKPAMAAGYEPPSKISFWDNLLENQPGRGDAIRDARLAAEAEHDQKWLNKAIAEMKGRDPVKFSSLKTEEEQVASAATKAGQSNQKFADTMNRAGGFDAVTGSFIGSGAAMFTDPYNLAATVATAGLGLPGVAAARAAGTSVAMAITKNVLLDAGVNAAIEAGQQPIVKEWQNEIGAKYGFKDQVENVGLAAIFGGGISAVSHGVKPLASMVFSKISNLPGLRTRERVAAKVMERDAMIKERDPFVGEPENVGLHQENLEVTQRKLANGERLAPTDLPTTNQEFLAKNTSPEAGRTVFEKNQLEELHQFKQGFENQQVPLVSVFHGTAKDFKEFLFPSGEKPFKPEGIGPHFGTKEQAQFVAEAKGGKVKDYYLDIKNPVRLEDQNTWSHAGVLKQLEDKGIITPEERTYLLNRTDNPDARQVLRDKGYDGIVYVNKAEGQGDSYIPLSQDQIKTQPKIIEEKISPKAEAKITQQEQALKDLGVVDEAPKSISTQQELYKELDSPEAAKAVEQDFNALLESEPDLAITLEDGSVSSVKKLAEQMKKDAKVVREITNCATGGGQTE